MIIENHYISKHNNNGFHYYVNLICAFYVYFSSTNIQDNNSLDSFFSNTINTFLKNCVKGYNSYYLIAYQFRRLTYSLIARLRCKEDWPCIAISGRLYYFSPVRLSQDKQILDYVNETTFCILKYEICK